MKTLNEERLKSYFLGELPAPDAESLEENCAFSAELTERAQMIESELVDDYLRGNLSAAESDSFETHYLITEARREKLYSARALWRVAGEANAPKAAAAPDSAISFWQRLFVRRKYFHLAWTAVLLLLVSGGLVFYLLTLSARRETASETTPPPRETAAVEEKSVQPPAPDTETPAAPDAETTAAPAPASKTASETASVDEKTVAAPAAAKSPENAAAAARRDAPKTERRKTTTFAAFLISAGTLRSEGEQAIKIAPETTRVSLLFNLPRESSAYPFYRATVKTADGETVYSSGRLGALNVVLPAEKLKNGTYIVFLEGEKASNAPESITEYTFRVSR
jgi:cytoskeletal protein RodZ